jgi:phospholipid/cholesterol/gamma-HCH transport system substrate-binding protein
MKKDWIARELTMEIIVGVFIIMVLLGLGYFTIMLSKDTWFGNKQTMEVVFNDVMGLRDGDNVVVRGMTVGKVKEMRLDKDGVHVVAVFNAGIKPNMKEDYRITIVATSILGGRYLMINEGSDAAYEIEDKSFVYNGEQPYDLIADAAELMNAVRRGVVEGGIVDNFQEASEAMRDIAGRLRNGKGTLGKLLSEDDLLYDDLTAAVSALKQISERVAKGEGTMGRLLGPDDQLYKDLAETVEALSNISTSIDEGDGTIGKLVRDEALYLEVKGAVEEIRAAIDDLRETTPVATFTSIFFGAF